MKRDIKQPAHGMIPRCDPGSTKSSTTFTEEEKSLIAVTHIINSDNSEYGTPGGNDMDNQWWWLRSPGKKQNKAVFILGRSADLMGNEVDYLFGIRPAIRVRYSGRKINNL